MVSRKITLLVLGLLAIAIIIVTAAFIDFRYPLPNNVSLQHLATETPSPTPFFEERLSRLEVQVSKLSEDSIVSYYKNLSDLIQSTITVIAIIVSGVWGYLLFVRNRQKYPQANIEHIITHKKITKTKLLLRVTVVITNTGNILISLVRWKTTIQQISPGSDKILKLIQKTENVIRDHDKFKTELQWPGLAIHEISLDESKHEEIEPGESHEIYHDFIIDAEVQTVLVYTYLTNLVKRKQQVGWFTTTIYDIPTKMSVPKYAGE